MSKIIFLDIDGPLVNHRTMLCSEMVDNKLEPHQFDVVGINLLNRLFQHDDSLRIVISSTWRKIFPNVVDLLACAGLKIPVFQSVNRPSWNREEFTPIINDNKDNRRGREIQEWLDVFEENVDKFCIIDDDSDMLESQMDNLVLVHGQNGILFDDFLKIQKILDIDIHKQRG